MLKYQKTKGSSHRQQRHTILRRLKELTDGDELSYKNYLKKVNILSTNRDLEEEVEKGAKMLAVNIEQTPFYRMGAKDGRKEATFESAIVMIERFKLSIDDIVKELNIKKDELLEYMKKRQLKKENQN